MKICNLFILMLLLVSFVYGQKAIEIKFATVAPEGSTWMQVMREFDVALQKATDDQVKFRIYAGMVQGDERDVLRKIRINQLHSAGFTGVGMGQILPEVRILDAPFLFRNYEEIDYVSERFFDRFAQKFEENGFVLLGWVEVGFVYVFTNQPVQSSQDFKGVKMWMWEGDPLAEATFRAFGISPIPLSLTDVLTSLQTGLIDGIYTSPLACIGLQWFTRTKYMINFPLTNSNGAALISKRMFDRLNPQQQKILLNLAKEYFGKLTRLTRQDNEKAITEMLKAGIQKIEITDPEILQSFQDIGRQTRQSLVGQLYDQELLDEVERAVQEIRSQKETAGEPQ